MAAGVLVLGAVWAGPLPELARGAFSAHMAMHVSVVAVAAPLLALGVAEGRFDPARRLPVVFAPLPASALELVVVWAWHAPALHHLARRADLWLAVEQGSFLASGLLVWLSAFGGPAGTRRSRRGAGIVGMLLTSMHMTLLGALLALASRALYPRPDTPWLGLTPLEDQHLGGALMLLGGGTAYLAGGIALALGLLRPGKGPRRTEPGAAP